MQYELSYILKSDMEETKIKEVTQDLVGFISKIGQELKVTIQPKILELAYPIKKQTQGLWGALEFDIEAKRLSELEKKLKDTKEIIRFMLTKKVVEKKEKPAQSEALGRARQTAELSAEKKLKEAPKKGPKEEKEKKEKQKPSPPEAKKEEKVEIEDLDKKLDEILKQI